MSDSNEQAISSNKPLVESIGEFYLRHPICLGLAVLVLLVFLGAPSKVSIGGIMVVIFFLGPMPLAVDLWSRGKRLYAGSVVLIWIMLIGAIEKQTAGAPPQAATIKYNNFGSFAVTKDRVDKALACQRSRISPASREWGGKLYGCILGDAQTVKIWINEEAERPDVVENVKVMWNDWRKDAGYGRHADRQDAEAALRAVAKMYFPSAEDEVVQAFYGRKQKEFVNEFYSVLFKFHRGPGIDERLVVIVARN